MYIKTQRLVLKPFEEADKALAVDMFFDDKIKQTYMLPDFASVEAAEKLFYRLKDLSEMEDREVVGIYLVDSEKASEVLIGFMNDVEKIGDGIEMGYVIDSKYHNMGYMTEALQGMIKALFAKGYKQVITGAFETNGASIRVMEICGMIRQEKVDEIEYRGRVHRCVYYMMESK